MISHLTDEQRIQGRSLICEWLRPTIVFYRENKKRKRRRIRDSNLQSLFRGEHVERIGLALIFRNNKALISIEIPDPSHVYKYKAQ